MYENKNSFVRLVDRKCDSDSVIFERLVSAYMAAGFSQFNHSQST
jgi:hypothetical protein